MKLGKILLEDDMQIIKSCYCYFWLRTYDLNAVNSTIKAGPY